MKLRKLAIVIFMFLVCYILILACNKFEYSPFQTEIMTDMPNDLNKKNIDKLLLYKKNADDTVTIIYSGDCQRYYDDLERLQKKVNTIPNIDFLIMCGDLADFGILWEYVWVYERLNKLKVPYFCVIGNHDLAANNGEVFTKMFGEKNFSFEYKGYKFLFHDSNGREYNFNGSTPNIQWLRDQLRDTIPKWFVGVSHVPPFNIDFDKTLEYPYKNLFSSAPGFIVSLHGHLHETSDSYYYGDSIRYMTSNSLNKKEFVLLKFIHGKIIKQMMAF